jgi:membrane protease YdiL (CAAX protease family)
MSATAGTTGTFEQDRPQRGRRDLVDLAVGFGLILTAIWTPQPWQRWVDWTALAWVLLITTMTFDGWDANGLRESGLLRSLWVVGAALAVAGVAIVLSARLNTLHAPDSVSSFVRRYWAYAVWAFLQEFLLLDFFLRRFLRVMRGKMVAVVVTAGLFTIAHLPNPVLAPLALLWALIACALFLRYRNLYTLGMAHAIFGICIAITVPAHADRNMRVGLGYLTYRAHHHHLNHIPQMVSTVAWVMDDAPTRRWSRQARP